MTRTCADGCAETDEVTINVVDFTFPANVKLSTTAWQAVVLAGLGDRVWLDNGASGGEYLRMEFRMAANPAWPV